MARKPTSNGKGKAVSLRPPAKDSEPRTRAEKPAAAPEPARSNGPDRDTVLFFAGQFRAIQKERSDLQLKRKKLRQRAKLVNIDVEQLDRALAEMDRNDGTTAGQLSTFAQYCQYLDLPLGYQLTLFTNPADARRASVEDAFAKAERVGYEHGLQGITPDEQAYPPMMPEGQAYMKKWHAGQAVLMSKLKKMDADSEADVKAKEGRKKGKDVELPPQEETDANLDELADA